MSKGNTGGAAGFLKTLLKWEDSRYKFDFGQFGCDYVSDTNSIDGSWNAIQATGDAPAVFNTLTTATGDDLDGVTIAAGQVIYGPFTTIDLTSGSIIAYRAVKLST